MPDSVSRVHVETTNNPIYMAVGPLPPDSIITNIRLIGTSTATALWRVAMGISPSRDASAAGLGAADPVIDGGNSLVDRKANMTFNTQAATTQFLDLPVYLRTPTNPSFLIVRVVSGTAGTTLGIIVIVNTLSDRELEGAFGIGRVIQ